MHGSSESNAARLESNRNKSVGTYHILWLFGEEGDRARAIPLDVLLDETHAAVGFRSSVRSRMFRRFKDRISVVYEYIGCGRGACRGWRGRLWL